MSKTSKTKRAEQQAAELAAQGFTAVEIADALAAQFQGVAVDDIAHAAVKAVRS